MKALSRYALVIALGIAVAISLVSKLDGDTARIAMLILGVIAGVMNCIGERSKEFLIAVIAIMLVGSAADEIDSLVSLGGIFGRILANFKLVAAPAAIIIAVKVLVTTAKQD